MKILTVHEPAMCCWTGFCGADIDQTLIDLAAFLVDGRLVAKTHCPACAELAEWACVAALSEVTPARSAAVAAAPQPKQGGCCQASVADMLKPMRDPAHRQRPQTLRGDTGSYHRDVLRHPGEQAAQMTIPMTHLSDPEKTRVLIVTLAETTPVPEAARLRALVAPQPALAEL